MTEPISADLPEFRLWAQLAGIAPSKLAAAFNDPQHFFEHLTLEELSRFTQSCFRLAALQAKMAPALDSYMAHATRSLETHAD